MHKSAFSSVVTDSSLCNGFPIGAGVFRTAYPTQHPAACWRRCRSHSCPSCHLWAEVTNHRLRKVRWQCSGNTSPTSHQSSSVLVCLSVIKPPGCPASLFWREQTWPRCTAAENLTSHLPPPSAHAGFGYTCPSNITLSMPCLPLLLPSLGRMGST